MTATSTAENNPRGRKHDRRSVRVRRRATYRADVRTSAHLRDVGAHERSRPGNGAELSIQPGGQPDSLPETAGGQLGPGRDEFAARIGELARRAAKHPAARSWAAGIYSEDERDERCHDAAVDLWLAGEELTPTRIAKRVRNQANRGAERQRLTRSVPLELENDGTVSNRRADVLDSIDHPNRIRTHRGARRVAWFSVIDEQEEREAVNAVMPKLSAGHQQILRAIAGNQTQAQIAKERGVSQVAVSRLWNRARDAFLPAYFQALGLPMPANPTRPRRRRRAA
jgi:hypothetical protein